MRRWIVTIVCVLQSLPTLLASHLIGGNFGYEYLGLQPNGKYRYRILLTTFTDCSPTSQIPYPENPIRIGIYEHDPANPLNDKLRADSLTLVLTGTETYTPDLPPGCTIGQNTCIIKGSYEAIVDLASSTGGYHLFYERCCRNVGIINLQPNQSASFHAFIPPTAMVNSSPVFTSSPIPFICVNDPTTILNTATDPDGDSLVFSFSTAYSGFGDVFNTLPQLPAPVLNWPIPPVTFVPGFTATQPFGASGTAAINSSNGTAIYTIPIPGPYVICVEVREYRNGQLIGTLRRDLQLLALPCPYNPPPELSGNLQQQYETEVGDTLCFPITFLDPNNDSVFLTPNGKLFDLNFFNPAASFSITATDSNSSTGTFCWIIPCQADTGEFEFTLQADDNGCPPKTNYKDYNITVHGPQPPLILGADTVCETTDSVLYYVPDRPGYTYSWQVMNGSIVQQMNDSVIVAWGTGTPGRVIVQAQNKYGCPAGSDTLEVYLMPVPVLDAMPWDTLCAGDTLMLTASGSLTTYYWYPPQFLLNPGVINPFTVADTTRWYYVAALPGHLCPPSDSVLVTVHPLPQPFATTDTSACYNDTLHLQAAPGLNYLWQPGALVSDSTLANPWVVVLQDMVVLLTVTDSNGCSNRDTVRLDMHPLPDILTDTSPDVCLGDTLQLQAQGGTVYSWSPPDYLSSASIPDPLAWPPATQTYLLTVTDSNSCTRDTLVTVNVRPVPDAAFTMDSVSASCEGFVFQMQNQSTGASHYLWEYSTGDQETNASPYYTFPYGQEYTIALTAYNAYQCDDQAYDTLTLDDLKKFVHYNDVNVFTPNDDGINDLLDFSLPPEFNGCSRVYVYNRWGLLVFEGNGQNPAWNGQSPQGAPVPEGVYFWIIDINGLQFNGNTSLMR